MLPWAYIHFSLGTGVHIDVSVPGPETRWEDMYGDSDFLKAVFGKKASSAWTVMDELMDTLHVVNPKVYESVMRKIKEL